MKHTLNTINGVFARMLASGRQRCRTTAYCAALALTAGAFGLTDGVPTVGGSASAQPGCYWDSISTTLGCPSIGSVPELPPSFECHFPCGSGYGEHWGPPMAPPLLLMETPRATPVPPVRREPERPSACDVFKTIRDVTNGMGEVSPLVPGLTQLPFHIITTSWRKVGEFGTWLTCP